MKVATLKVLAGYIAAGDNPTARAMIAAILETETGAHWRRDLAKLYETLGDGVPRFKILAKDGNSKLPFLAFSSLPGAGFCPGAGDCLQFCYSFRAWRYPAAFCRQAQNSVLMQSETGRRAILAALDKFQDDETAVDFRLYVDGDFKDMAAVRFWMHALMARPWLNAYGYSKSFRELLEFDEFTGGVWPTNYRLNLSSGHKHGGETMAKVAALPITRGEFVAVEIGRKVRNSDHANRDHQAELRAVYGKKAFTCPGKCGTCTPKGHACGSARFTGIPIIIAVH